MVDPKKPEELKEAGEYLRRAWKVKNAEGLRESIRKVAVGSENLVVEWRVTKPTGASSDNACGCCCG